MKRTVLAILIAALTLPVFAQKRRTSRSATKATRPPLMWKGVAIGAPADEALSSWKSASISCDESTKAQGFVWCEDTVQLDDDTRLNVDMRVDNDQFAYLSGTFDTAQWDFVRDVFLQKFGKPDSDTHEVVQNKMGASFDDETLKWLRPEGSLFLHKYGADLTTGLVLMLTPKEADRRAEKDEEEKKRAAKKF